MTPEWMKVSPATEVMAAVDLDRMWQTLEYFSTLNRDSGKTGDALQRQVKEHHQSR